MNFFDYAFHHIGCVVRIIRGEQRAISDMDISGDGFWRSFEAIPAAFPALLFAWVVEAHRMQIEGVAGSTASLIARMALLELIFWILPIIALAMALRPLGFASRFPHLIIARNWLAAVASYLFVVVPLSEVFSGASDIVGWLTLFMLALILWFSVRITRTALDTSVGIAIGFVAAETMITFPLAVTLYELAGMYPTA
ncbi:hypothetical protein [Oricola cellulosilytica]|uniref:Yip1 domain-containing protein n=1 Tax=Oricola cellulosilytica TaxID=1429082 RepID=A0A4R0PHI6_9HYPH|nr:hypothetical protein [Oricola cellulosilytica]TCD16468.1 hypothetical protein E0D97_03320 [Oricola cellulosilytica]